MQRLPLRLVIRLPSSFCDGLSPPSGNNVESDRWRSFLIELSARAGERLTGRPPVAHPRKCRVPGSRMPRLKLKGRSNRCQEEDSSSRFNGSVKTMVEAQVTSSSTETQSPQFLKVAQSVATQADFVSRLVRFWSGVSLGGVLFFWLLCFAGYALDSF